MREAPLGDDLLEAAHRVLKDTLIPVLPMEQRHAAMMVASAIAIAMRQFRSGEWQEQDEFIALGCLLADKPTQAPTHSPVGKDALRAGLQTLHRTLCQQIRIAQPGSRPLSPAVYTQLLQGVRQTIMDSSPKYFR